MSPSAPRAHRQIARRDGRAEGEPDEEPGSRDASRADRAMKDAQRDLTSLSGPVRRTNDDE